MWGDSRLMGNVVLWTRANASREPVESTGRRTLVAFNRGFVTGSNMWSWWKRRRLRDLPDEAGDDLGYRSGFAAGEYLGAVMWALVVTFRHVDLSDLRPLTSFATYYGISMTSEVVTKVQEDKTVLRRGSVLEWIGDADTLMRAHAAAAYEAESHGFGVGETIELEFLRATAARTKVPLPDNAVALIAERRRDAPNLPTGVDWSRLPEPASAGGPTDGMSAISAEGAKALQGLVQQAEWSVILDTQGDGAWTDRGLLAGLTALDRVPLLMSEVTDVNFYRGRLAGSLWAALIRSRGQLPVGVSGEAAYQYARALTWRQAQAFLREPPPDGVLKADGLARRVVRQRTGNVEDADVLAFFNWLAEQAEVAVTPAILEKREHIVFRSTRNESEDPPGSEGRPGSF